MPQWMATGANIREMHQSIAAGVGLELSADGNDWMLKGEVVDENTRKKVERGVLKGYSIGIKGARIVTDETAPNGRIVGGQIVEVSLVDRPANPTATVTIAKSYDGGELEIAKGIDLSPLIPDTQLDHSDVANLVPQLQVHDTNQQTGAQKDSEDPYPATKVCPGCNGTGVTADSNEQCVVCNGSGKHPDEWPINVDSRNTYENMDLGAKAATSDSKGDVLKALATDLAKMEHNPDDLKSVMLGLINLAKAELDEMAAGEENEIGDVAQLLAALDTYLDWWQNEAVENETTAPFTTVTSGEDMNAYIGLGVSADLIKSVGAEDATEETKTELRNEIVKALGLSESIITKAELSEAKEEIALLKAALDEVREMATPGGPVLRATNSQVAKAADAERLQAEASRYRKLANEVHDPTMKAGYLQKALACETDAAAIFRN